MTDFTFGGNLTVTKDLVVGQPAKFQRSTFWTIKSKNINRRCKWNYNWRCNW